MTDLSSGPPFPRQPDGAADAAQDMATQAGRIEGLASDVAASHEPAQAAVGGTLVAPMALAPVQTLQSIQQMSQTAVFAAGALQSFANAVATYNATIDRLNQRWTEGVASNFGVVPPLLPSGSTTEDFRDAQNQYENAVNAAREQLRTELRGEQRRAEALLDDAADTARGMLRRGPNATDVQAMASSGVFNDLWNAIKGQVMPAGNQLGNLGVGLWGLGRGLWAFEKFSDYMANVRLGKMAFPPMSPLFQAQYSPWYRWSGRDTWLLTRNYNAARAPWLTSAKWASRAAAPLGFVVPGATQWQQDAGMDGSERVARTGYRAAAEGGAGLAAGAACAGPAAAAASPSGPGAFVAGGAAGLVCGIAGKEAASEIVDWTIKPVGEAGAWVINGVGDGLAEADDAIDDAGEEVDKVTPWDGVAPW